MTGAADPARPAGTLLRGAVLAVVLLDVVLLALTEVAWLTLRAGTVPVPVSALVAAVTVPVAVRIADRCFPGTRVALAPVGLWLLVVVVVGFWGLDGSGMLPPDWRTLLLIAAGLLPGVWMAGRPAPTTTSAA